MPLFKEWQRGPAHALIWKIEEPEDFFSEQTGLLSDRKSAVRRLEHLAGRFLLQELMPGLAFADIEISPLGKPFLRDNSVFFSISHSYPYIGVVTDREKETGIDVQTLQEKILRLQYKFLSAEEQTICDNQAGRITLAWAAKEAAFKRYGLGAVDFIRHMPIRDMQLDGPEATLHMEFSREQPSLLLQLCGGLEADFAWSVTT